MVFSLVIAWDWGDAASWFAVIIALVAAIAFVAERLDDRRVLASRIYVVVGKSTASDDSSGGAEDVVPVTAQAGRGARRSEGAEEVMVVDAEARDEAGRAAAIRSETLRAAAK